jgi:hypothetical protein
MPRWPVLGLVAAALAGLLVFGCGDGEDRPGVDVIDGGSPGSGSSSASNSGEPSGSSSASGGPATSATAIGGTAGGYNVSSNVGIYFDMALDLDALRESITAQPADWQAATTLYEKGKFQVAADGSVRPLAAIPSDAVHAVFPNGPATYGQASFIDAVIRAGLAGTGRASGLSDGARAEIVEKGVLMLFYGKAVQEFGAAKTRLESGSANPAVPVDEAWAIIAGEPDESGEYSRSLLATAKSREGNFGLDGRLAGPLEDAFIEAQEAALNGDREALASAYDEGRGYLNAIFYLSALRYAALLPADATAQDREEHLAEGWAYWQTIRATVAAASPQAASTVESAFNRPADDAFPTSLTTGVYAALNDPAVLSALGIPAAVQVRTPPAP